MADEEPDEGRSADPQEPGCERYQVILVPSSRTREVQAKCSCGWVSAAVGAPGIAGGLWDMHKSETASP